MDGIEPETLSQNRLASLEFLRDMAEKKDLQYQETCVLSWGQIARYVLLVVSFLDAFD